MCGKWWVSWTEPSSNYQWIHRCQLLCQLNVFKQNSECARYLCLLPAQSCIYYCRLIWLVQVFVTFQKWTLQLLMVATERALFHHDECYFMDLLQREEFSIRKQRMRSKHNHKEHNAAQKRALWNDQIGIALNERSHCNLFFTCISVKFVKRKSSLTNDYFKCSRRKVQVFAHSLLLPGMM